MEYFVNHENIDIPSKHRPAKRAYEDGGMYATTATRVADFWPYP